MASNTAQPTVGLLLLAALIVAALGTRPTSDQASESIGKAEGPNADRPDPRTLRDLAGLSVGLDALREFGAMIEATPSVVAVANRSAEQGVAALERAADAWRQSSSLVMASMPQPQPQPQTAPVTGIQSETVAVEASPESVSSIASRLGLLRPEVLAAWSDAITGALGRSREAAVESLAALHASLGDHASSIGERLAVLAEARAPVSSGLRLFASAGSAERPAPVAPPNILLSPEPALPASPTGHGGWWSPLGSDLPGFETGWYDQLTDSMLPHDYDIPHAR